jgi:hypothetical protein
MAERVSLVRLNGISVNSVPRELKHRGGLHISTLLQQEHLLHCSTQSQLLQGSYPGLQELESVPTCLTTTHSRRRVAMTSI